MIIGGDFVSSGITAGFTGAGGGDVCLVEAAFRYGAFFKATFEGATNENARLLLLASSTNAKLLDII